MTTVPKEPTPYITVEPVSNRDIKKTLLLQLRTQSSYP